MFLLYVAEIAKTASQATDSYLSDSDFSASNSEYMPSDSDRSSSSEDESVEDKDETMKEPEYQPRRKQGHQEIEYVSSRINCSGKPNKERSDNPRFLLYKFLHRGQPRYKSEEKTDFRKAESGDCVGYIIVSSVFRRYSDEHRMVNE